MAVDKILSYGGIGVVAATFELDSTTISALDGDYEAAVNKTVAITASGTVGYGTEGDPLFGIILKADARGLATVQVKGFAEGVAISSTAGKKPAAGNIVAVNGAGALVKYVEATVAESKAPVKALGGVAYIVDTTANTATILL